MREYKYSALNISLHFFKDLSLIENDQRETLGISREATNVLCDGHQGTHTYLLLPLTLAQKPQVLLNSCRHLTLEKSHKQSFSHLLSFIFLSRSLTLSLSLCPPSVPLTDLKSDKSRQDFYIHEKGREKDNTHRLTQYMQSEAVFFDGKAFTHGRRGIDTEIGRTLLPMRRFLPGNWKRVGELQKRFS